MNDQAKWLREYYGSVWMARLDPVVYLNGKEHAIIRVNNGTSIGFVLIRKNGNHGVTAEKAVHEGSLLLADVERMHRILDKADL